MGQLQRYIYIRKITGIQQQRIALLSHGAGKRVHDSAPVSDILIFRELSEQTDIHHTHICIFHHIPENQTGHHFQRSRGTQPQPFRDLSIVEKIQPSPNRIIFLSKCVDHAFGIIGPSVFLPVFQFFHRHFQHPCFRIIKGIKTKHTVRPLSRRSVCPDGNRTWKHMSSVIICMFADQIYSSRREIYFYALFRASINIQKFVDHLLFHHILP